MFPSLPAGAERSSRWLCPWSIETCLQLLELAGQPPQEGSSSKPSSLRMLDSASPAVHPAAGDGPAAHLLVPPAVLAHMLDLIQGALAQQQQQPAPAPTSQPGSWAGTVAVYAALLSAACFQGLSQPHMVLVGPMPQHAMAAAERLHHLLTAASEEDKEPAVAAGDGAAAAGGGRRAQRGKRRLEAGRSNEQRSKRQKQDAAAATAGGGDALAELLQLFQPHREEAASVDAGPVGVACPPAAAPAVGRGGGRRIQAEPINHQHGSGVAADGRKHIVPQLMARAGSNLTGPADLGAAAQQTGGGSSRSCSGVEVLGGDQGEEQEEDEARGEVEDVQEHVLISNAPGMTDEQREANWAAYIADKEYMVEMLGVSCFLSCPLPFCWLHQGAGVVVLPPAAHGHAVPAALHINRGSQGHWRNNHDGWACMPPPVHERLKHHRSPPPETCRTRTTSNGTMRQPTPWPSRPGPPWALTPHSTQP